jgi:ribonuclease HI
LIPPHTKKVKVVKVPRRVVVEFIIKNRPYAFFDGTSEGDPHMGGAIGVFHFSTSHSLTLNTSMGHGFNKFSELMALKLLLTLALEYRVTHLQVFGHSLLVIKCMRKKFVLGSFTLQPLFDEVWSLQVSLTSISFVHIFRERNLLADSLSKDGLDLMRREWLVLED